MGGCTTASQLLNEVKHTDETLALTLFIMGHVEFQLDQADKAEDCFRASLSALDGPTQSFDRFGFEFVLRGTRIMEDLRTAEEGLSSSDATLAPFPAEGLFQCPRYWNGNVRPSPRQARTSIDSGLVPALSDGGSSPTSPGTPTEEYSLPSLEYNDGDVRWHALPEHPDLLVPERTSSIAKVPMPSSIEQTPTMLGKFKRRLSDRQSWNVPIPRLPKKLEAREARVQGDRTNDLSSFLMDIRPPGLLEARDAEPEYGDTRDIAEFLNADLPTASLDTDRPVVSRRNSDASVYSTDIDARSVNSNELTGALTPPINSTSEPPSLSKYPYRSGIGSLLLNENSHDDEPVLPLRSSARQQPSFFSQIEDGSQEVLPGIGGEGVFGEIAVGEDAESWPLTPRAESLCRASMRSGRPPIGSRSSSYTTTRSTSTVTSMRSSAKASDGSRDPEERPVSRGSMAPSTTASITPSFAPSVAPSDVTSIAPSMSTARPASRLSSMSALGRMKSLRKPTPSLLGSIAESSTSSSKKQVSSKDTFKFLAAFGRM